MLPIWLLAAMMIMMHYYWRFWEPWANAMLVVLLPKLWFRIENHDWHNCFWMSSWGSPLLDPKKLQNQQFYKIDWIRKNSWSMLPIWLLAAMMIMMYYWRFWEPWANAMLAVLLPKLWFWIENHDWHNCFWMSSWGSLTLTGPKKASKSTILYNRLNKEKTPGRCCQSGYLLPWWLWCTIGGLGTLRKCYVSSPVAQTLVLDWKSWLAQLFLDVFLGLTLTGPKEASKRTILIDWIWKKLLVDVANLATCCHDDDDDDVLLEVLGTLRKCYVSSLLGLTTFPPTRSRVSGKRFVAFGSLVVFRNRAATTTATTTTTSHAPS